MSRSRTMGGVAAAAVLAACSSVPAPAPQGPAARPAGVDTSNPQVSWELRAGGDFGDARTVCSSSQRTPTCRLPPSTDASHELATVRVYLHAAERETRYLGTVQVPFVAGAGHGSLDEINMTVPSNSAPVGATINGLVTRTPGDYQFSFALDALQVGAAEPVRLARSVPVTVGAALPE